MEVLKLQKGLRFLSLAVIVAVVLFFSLIGWAAHLYTDWLWFNSLNYQQVFKTILVSELGLRLAVGLATFVFLFLNLFLTRRSLVNAARLSRPLQDEEGVVTLYPPPAGQFLNYRTLTVLFALASAVLGFFLSLGVSGDWVILQKFLHATPFGTVDPVFQKDIGFYFFALPFYQFLYKLCNWWVLLTAFVVALVYFVAGVMAGQATKPFQSIAACYHLSALAAIFFLIRAGSYRLQQYTLLYSKQGVVYGPGYTDLHANLLAYKIMFILALLVGVVIIVSAFLKRFRPVLYAIGFLVVASVVLNGIYPALIQKLIVLPNEMEREKPYIENNIKMTRLAYDLDKVEKKDFPAGRTITAEDVRENQDTIKNIRLWDYRPLQQTYGQLQEMRTYYEFKDIDVDRYVINGRYRQVMLAARELNVDSLPEQAKTWVNQHLKYTHGYGIAMSPVNEVTGEGLPQFFIKDIPPTSQTSLKVERPEIYFGELTDEYIIVNTRDQEFDYPVGEDNAWCTYQGKNGVPVKSFLRRLLFAVSFRDYKLLLAREITNESQVLYYRNIKERVRKIAPFLLYDQDPYIVLSGGKLYWLWDAYTVSDMFPYSEPFQGRLNYIRNAVKVVIDAYTGEITFYAAEPTEPVLQTFQKIFPGMFVPLAEMPADLKSHIRYPEDLFAIQARKYTVYHMQDYRVFYNKEDKWNLPTELFGTKEEAMEPYYTIVRLPGEEKPEFIQIMPFTPQDKKNMIAWLAGRSDGEAYGKLLVYEFPKQELVYGPMQIEARINQDTFISQQISLWDQRGSQVIRGNLLVIPIKNALIYIEPLYLQAEQSKLPELRRVIVAHGDKVVMEPALDQALQKIFGEWAAISPAQPAAPQPEQERTTTPKTIPELAREASRLYDEAQNKLKQGDWAGYGSTLEKLKATLEKLAAEAQ